MGRSRFIALLVVGSMGLVLPATSQAAVGTIHHLVVDDTFDRPGLGACPFGLSEWGPTAPLASTYLATSRTTPPTPYTARSTDTTETSHFGFDCTTASDPQATMKFTADGITDEMRVRDPSGAQLSLLDTEVKFSFLMKTLPGGSGYMTVAAVAQGQSVGPSSNTVARYFAAIHIGTTSSHTMQLNFGKYDGASSSITWLGSWATVANLAVGAAWTIDARFNPIAFTAQGTPSSFRMTAAVYKTSSGPTTASYFAHNDLSPGPITTGWPAVWGKRDPGVLAAGGTQNNLNLYVDDLQISGTYSTAVGRTLAPANQDTIARLWATAPAYKTMSTTLYWSEIPWNSATNTYDFSNPALLKDAIDEAHNRHAKLIVRILGGSVAPRVFPTDATHPQVQTVTLWGTSSGPAFAYDASDNLAASCPGGEAQPCNSINVGSQTGGRIRIPVPWDQSLAYYYGRLLQGLNDFLIDPTRAYSDGTLPADYVLFVPVAMPTEMGSEMQLGFGSTSTGLSCGQIDANGCTPDNPNQAKWEQVAKAYHGGIWNSATQTATGGTMPGDPEQFLRDKMVGAWENAISMHMTTLTSVPSGVVFASIFTDIDSTSITTDNVTCSSSTIAACSSAHRVEQWAFNGADTIATPNTQNPGAPTGFEWDDRIYSMITDLDSGWDTSGTTNDKAERQLMTYALALNSPVGFQTVGSVTSCNQMAMAAKAGLQWGLRFLETSSWKPWADGFPSCGTGNTSYIDPGTFQDKVLTPLWGN